MRIRKQTLGLIFLWIISTMFFIFCGDKNYSLIIFSILFILVATLIVLVSSFVYCIKSKEIISPIFVANAFLACVFIFRPIQIILSMNEIYNIYTIGMYSRLCGIISFLDLPILQASYIGFCGILFMNMAYFGIRVALPENKLHSFLDMNDFNYNDRRFNAKQAIAIMIVMCPVLVSMGSFIIKQIVLITSIRMMDVIWVYIICALIIYLISYKGSPSLFIYFLIAISSVVLGIASKRMYVVNLIICFIVPLYYLGDDSKKNIRKVIQMIIILLVLVIIYGSIRAKRIGATQGTVIEQLLDEFCMYDMLLVSLKHCEDYNIGLFYGYNYLTIFTTIIPWIDIAQFDHELTRIVFNGLFNGGIPVTIFGSLFFNFSYLGVIGGSLILGYFFRKIYNRCTSSISVNSIMYYSIFTTFAYDIIRVGDIGREMWTCIIMIVVSRIFMIVVPCCKNELT